MGNNKHDPKKNWNRGKKLVDASDQYVQEKEDSNAQSAASPSQSTEPRKMSYKSVLCGECQPITQSVSSMVPCQSTEPTTVSSTRKISYKSVLCGEVSDGLKQLTLKPDLKVEEPENDDPPSTSPDSESFSDIDIEEILKLCDEEFIGGWDHLLTNLKSMSNYFGDLDIADNEKLDLASLREIENRLWAAVEKLNKQAQDAESSSESGSDAEAAACRDKANKLKRKAKNEEMKNSFKVFNERSESSKNHLLCDVHRQHQKEAMAIFESHLWLVYYIRSIRSLTVTTGHGQKRGKVSVLKNAIIDFLKEKKIRYEMVDEGSMLINIEDIRRKWWAWSANDDNTE